MLEQKDIALQANQVCFFFLFGAIRTKPEYCLINCWQLLSPFSSFIICLSLIFLPLPQTVQHPPCHWNSLMHVCACLRLPGGFSTRAPSLCQNMFAFACLLTAERCAHTSLAGLLWNVITQVLLSCIYEKDKLTREREASDEERIFWTRL